MVLSKVFNSSFTGAKVRAEQSSFLSVNPGQEPGSMLFVGTCAERAAIGGQVASKLALQHFVIGAEQSLTSNSKSRQNSEISLDALEAAFRNSNSAVYEFGRKLSAGGRMAASLISIFIRDGFIAAGRVGTGVAYLARQGEVFPFFTPHSEGHEIAYVGSNSLVSVELASVPAEPGDVIIVFSEPVPNGGEAELGYSVSLLLPRFDQVEPKVAFDSTIQQTAIERLDSRCCDRLTNQVFGSREPAFASILAIGPEVNFLSYTNRVDRQQTNLGELR